jgi:Ca2+:H+ antiporter
MLMVGEHTKRITQCRVGVDPAVMVNEIAQCWRHGRAHGGSHQKLTREGYPDRLPLMTQRQGDPRLSLNFTHVLLLFVPASLLASHYHAGDAWIFGSSCLAVVPLAILIGDATEQIAGYTGPKLGGLINATMGNIPELFIGFFAVKAGLYGLVLASMVGSIIGNIMLVLGLSILVGGMRHKFQSFDRNIARSNFSLLCFAAVSLVVPLAFQITNEGQPNIEQGLTVLSFAMSVLLLLIYVLGLTFSFVTHRNLFVQYDNNGNGLEPPEWSLRRSVTVLAIAAGLVALESEMLVKTVEGTVKDIGLPEAFIGVIIVPLIGNVAEHASAILMARKNKINISLEIAVGSSMQIAMFVAPLLVLISFTMGRPLIYLYDSFEVVAVLTGILIALFVFQDGETYWLEGALLLFCYVTFGIAFYFVQLPV